MPSMTFKMQLIAHIQDSEATKKILESLKMSTAPPIYRPEEYQVSYKLEANHDNAEYDVFKVYDDIKKIKNNCSMP